MIPKSIIPGTRVMRVKPGYDSWLSTQCDTRGVGKLDNAIVRVIPWEEPVDPSLNDIACVMDGYGVGTTIPTRFLEPMEIL